jgi:predicted  nucleic acid-binding Zn-ribbon protein
LGESMVINMTMYPRKDEMPFLTKVVEISALHAANEKNRQLEQQVQDLTGALSLINPNLKKIANAYSELESANRELTEAQNPEWFKLVSHYVKRLK